MDSIKKSIYILLTFCFICSLQTFSIADTADNFPFDLCLKRHFKDRITLIPLTEACFLYGASLPLEWMGWLIEDDFRKDEKSFVLLLEMNSTSVPPGPWWQDAGGSFQLALQVDNINSGRKIVLTEMDKNRYYLINNFAGFKNPNEISGELNIDWVDETKIILSGNILIKSNNPQTVQEISFKESSIKLMSLGSFIQQEKRKKQKEEEREEKEREIYDKISKMKENFYNNIFTLDKYPRNNLTGTWVKQNIKVGYKIDSSYIAEGGKIIEEPSEDFIEILGGDIFEIGPGPSYVLHLHHFDDPDTNIIDDEANFLILIELNELIPKRTYPIEKKAGQNAKFGYIHFGPGGYLLSSIDASGKVSIDAIHKNIARGELSVKFTLEDKNEFLLQGKFELPIIQIHSIIDFKNQIEKFKQDEESKL